MSIRNPATPRSSQKAMMSFSACRLRRGPGASTASRHGSPSCTRGPAEVERGLLVVEVLQVPALPRARARAPRRGCREMSAGHASRGQLLGPHVAVALRVGPVGVQLPLEPRVLDRGVPGDEVEQDPDAARPGLGDQLDHVVVGAVPRRDPQVVGHVVAGVDERRGEAGVEPQRVDPERGDVVEAVDDAAQVTDRRRRRSRRTTAGRSRRAPRRGASPSPCVCRPSQQEVRTYRLRDTGCETSQNIGASPLAPSRQGGDKRTLASQQRGARPSRQRQGCRESAAALTTAEEDVCPRLAEAYKAAPWAE